MILWSKYARISGFQVRNVDGEAVLPGVVVPLGFDLGLAVVQVEERFLDLVGSAQCRIVRRPDVKQQAIAVGQVGRLSITKRSFMSPRRWRSSIPERRALRTFSMPWLAIRRTWNLSTTICACGSTARQASQ